jgi:histone acetyltransferase MYST1
MPRGTRRAPPPPTPTEVVEVGNESETTDNSEAMNSSQVYIGNNYFVTWRNGQVQPATIVDRRTMKKSKHRLSETNEQESFEYYVHYTNYDRRLDEWVTVDRIDLDVNCNDGEFSSRVKATTTKKMKRKLDDISGASSQREDKLALLSSLEKEYEEITKVKNIQMIEMGKFEIGSSSLLLLLIMTLKFLLIMYVTL